VLVRRWVAGLRPAHARPTASQIQVFALPGRLPLSSV